VILPLVRIRKILLIAVFTSVIVIREESVLKASILTKNRNVVKISVQLDVQIQVRFQSVTHANRKGKPSKTPAVVKCITNVWVE
jgi:hypothetical protein